MEPPPNPFATHPNDDPDHLAARQAHIDFAAKVQPIRDNPRLTELAKTEALAALYEQHTAEVAGAYERVQARRQTRLDYLNGLVPSGPGIPEDASPADRAVLMAAFRTALEQAKTTDRDGRERLLGEAVRYGDDSMQRAVLQHANESGDLRLVSGWVAQAHGVKGYADERTKLQGALERSHVHAPWDRKDFRLADPPVELRGQAV